MPKVGGRKCVKVILKNQRAKRNHKERQAVSSARLKIMVMNLNPFVVVTLQSQTAQCSRQLGFITAGILF